MASRVALEGVFPTPLPEPRRTTLFIQDPRTTITPTEAHRLGRVIVNLTRAHHPPTRDQLAGAVAALDGARTMKAPALLHCKHGIHRTGYVLCWWLVRRRGWEVDRALDEFERVRGARPRPSMERHLRARLLEDGKDGGGQEGMSTLE